MKLDGLEDMSIGFALFTFLTLCIGMSVYWGLRFAWYNRELEHVERMRALECGETLPRDRGANPGIAIGMAVPCTAFGFALVASLFDAGVYAWPAAGAVGTAAVICGTILALNPHSSPSCRSGPPRGLHAKPTLDPDAIDVVSRRG